MIAIVIVLSIVALVLATARAFSALHVEIAASPGWPGDIFVSRSMPDRPRGVQEEDLPPFVFRDRVASPEDGAIAQAPVRRTAPVPC